MIDHVDEILNRWAAPIEHGMYVGSQMRNAQRDIIWLVGEIRRLQGETIHLCPPGDEGLTPCCGRTPFELPSTDRLTEVRNLVTCR